MPLTIHSPDHLTRIIARQRAHGVAAMFQSFDPESFAPAPAADSTEGGDPDDLRDECEALCREVAPRDLDEAPLYVVWKHELPADLQASNMAGGWAPDLDLVAREAIGDRWEGRGPCLMIDLDHAPARPDLYGLVLHELAHELNELPDREEQSGAAAAELVNATREAFEWQADGNEHAGEGAEMPMFGHEWPFIRAALHLQTRAAAAAGIHVPAALVFNPVPYNLSAIGAYARALGDEPGRLRRKSFRRIAATAPPAGLQRLWRADFGAWLASDEAAGATRYILAWAERAPATFQRIRT